MKKFIVTGGCGFIGSTLIRHIIKVTDHKVINIDKLTYAGSLDPLIEIKDKINYSFKKIDICDAVRINRLFREYKPDIIIHLAAETHVDRSIDKSKKFVETNILGTHILLDEARKYWSALKGDKKKNSGFIM